MSQGFEKIFNLPSMEELIESGEIEAPVGRQETVEFEPNYDLENLPTKAPPAAHLTALADVDHAQAMDVIHQTTLRHADELMSLGYNVDQRSMATIFEKANMLYKTALDAKNSKIDAQLKIKKVMLDQRKLDLEEMKLRHEMGDRSDIVDAEDTVVIDRNEMIRKLREDAIKQKAERAALAPPTIEVDWSQDK
jgi:hypothetical protein